jgi:hypothetical protein
VRLEVRRDRLRSAAEQFDGGRLGQWRERILALGRDVERLAARDEEDDAGTARDQLGEVGRRVEDGVVLWERDAGTLGRAMAASPAMWPQPDLQWIEDRFWVWVHYVAGKIGRGELFECLDACAYFRSVVFGPLLAARRGLRPQGVRRLERYAGDALAELEATVGDHSREGCLRALRASVGLYTRLRGEMDDGRLVRRADAEAASREYLDRIAATAAG